MLDNYFVFNEIQFDFIERRNNTVSRKKLGKSCAQRNRLILKRKYGIYESVVAFLITGLLRISAGTVGKEQRHINEKMHFLRRK